MERAQRLGNKRATSSAQHIPRAELENQNDENEEEVDDDDGAFEELEAGDVD